MEKNEKKRNKSEISKDPKPKKSKEIPDEEASYTFKITLRPEEKSKNIVWRDLLIGAHHTLENFQAKIQEAFGFDNNQVSAFFPDGKPYSKKAYYSELSNNKMPCMKDYTVGELGFHEGITWLYIFDFGAEWTFDVKVIKVNPSGPTLKDIAITEKFGDPPAQLEDQESFESTIDSHEGDEEEEAELEAERRGKEHDDDEEEDQEEDRRPKRAKKDDSEESGSASE